MNLDMRMLEKYRSSEVELTQREIDHFMQTYHIDLLKCSMSDIKLLIDFMNNGAGAAIMARILNIFEDQQIQEN